MIRFVAAMVCAVVLLIGCAYSEQVSCGNETCDSESSLGCCDDYGKADSEKHCVTTSFCELKGNKWAWLVTLISFFVLIVFIVLLCVAKARLYKDRVNYFN